MPEMTRVLGSSGTLLVFVGQNLWKKIASRIWTWLTSTLVAFGAPCSRILPSARVCCTSLMLQQCLDHLLRVRALVNMNHNHRTLLHMLRCVSAPLITVQLHTRTR